MIEDSVANAENSLPPSTLTLQLKIQVPGMSTKPLFKRLTGKRVREVQCEPVTVQAGGDIRLAISITLPAGCDWTTGASSAWQVIPGNIHCTNVHVSAAPPPLECLGTRLVYAMPLERLGTRLVCAMPLERLGTS